MNSKKMSQHISVDKKNNLRRISNQTNGFSSPEESYSANESIGSKAIITPEVRTFTSDYQDVYSQIENAFTKRSLMNSHEFPHPLNLLGPRFLAIWVIPIIILRKLISLIKNLNFINAFEESDYKIKHQETIYTSVKYDFTNGKNIRFFGARFMAIWLLPFCLTGFAMEILFVSPLQGVSPFN